MLVRELIAIFLAAFASLLFEVTVVKIFEFSLWANYAYLMISTAMLGIGISGIVLTRWPSLSKIPGERFLPFNTFACAITMIGAFFVINGVPVHLPQAPDGWVREAVNVAVVFLALGAPYFFFGMLIGYIFDNRGRMAGVYYCADLVGAGLGALAIVPLITPLEPQGLVLLCAVVTAIAAVLFLYSGPQTSRPLRTVATAVVALVVAAAIWETPRLADHVPLKVHVRKRAYNKDAGAGKVERHGWSVLSRVDIAPFIRNRKRVWIAGGVNESSIAKFNGDFEALRTNRTTLTAAASAVMDHKAIPHILRKDHDVCIIGTSGGEDAYYALAMGARHVMGVEMDPMIVKFVTEDYREYAGGLFTDGKYSDIVVDEGRSYLQRCGRQFDVIQQINNFTPIAFQNGALNLSETYLLTVESFETFYDCLKDDGILSISRYGSIRLLSIAVEMFRRKGMKPEEYSKHLFVGEGAQPVINTFMMKKSAFTPEEVDQLFAYYNQPHKRRILYAPYRTEKLPRIENNLYYKIATSERPQDHWRLGCFDFSPSTDARPFFNKMKVLGAKDGDRASLPSLPGETIHIEGPSYVRGRIPKGDFPPILVLVESVFFALIFFGVPMLTKSSLRNQLRREARELGYFACLGLAFIFVEICLMQRLVLFLGAPVYSISAVLCSLLVAAGIGALISNRFEPTPRRLRLLLLAVAAAVLLVDQVLPLLNKYCLGWSLPARFTIAAVVTGLAGVLMGMPMPSGVRYLKSMGHHNIPWAWATNGFFTVIGTALVVLIASITGFPLVFYVAAALYAIAPLFFRPGGAAPSP